MGMYSGLPATELDSHANMAVAGNETTIIARSGAFANVTPFLKKLPAMDMVEIVDAAMCFDDPISLETYILVMKNALLIPTMGHSLIPPFLIREAGLILDETPKHQTSCPSIDNNSIRDQRTGLSTTLRSRSSATRSARRATCGAPRAGWMTCPKSTKTRISSTSRPRRPLRIA
jgi:hypothetical protein